MSCVVAEEALCSPRRRILLAAVQANPGIAFRELSRLTGLAPGTARHHLTVLRRGGFIVERSHGVTLRFFDAAVGHDQAWVEVVLRREPALAALHDWLKAHPRASQDQVVEGMAAHGWPRSTTQHRLARLVEAGLSTLFLRGRYKIYSAATQPARQWNCTAFGGCTCLPLTPRLYLKHQLVGGAEPKATPGVENRVVHGLPMTSAPLSPPLGLSVPPSPRFHGPPAREGAARRLLSSPLFSSACGNPGWWPGAGRGLEYIR